MRRNCASPNSPCYLTIHHPPPTLIPAPQRNHHMFSSVGAWLYKDLAGITQVQWGPGSTSSSSIGFAHPVLHPRVTSHAALPYTNAFYNALPGRFSVAWSNSSATQCGAGAESTTVTFTCPAGTVISGVQFASFGTPAGSCGSYTTGTCNAANSSAVVASLCVGKPSCAIAVGDALFGDPCFNTVKTFAGQVLCSGDALAVAVSVPANTGATVRLPFDPARGVNVTVTEAGAAVFVAGAFVPGVPGVVSATLSVASGTVDVEVGSGDFNFVAAQH